MTSRMETRRRQGAGAIACLALALIGAPLAAASRADAQDQGTLEAKPLPPLANPSDPNNPAKELFGRKATPAQFKSEVLGFYAKGCLAGAQALPINGRPAGCGLRATAIVTSELDFYIERLSQKGARWAGAGLVGDMSQPRGGPMLTGHASHQIGLDADIWLRRCRTTS